MKKLIATLALTISFVGPISTHAQVGIGTTSPDSDALLEISSTDKGVLLPRISLSNTTNCTPLSAHVAGMFIFNTATTGDVTPGLYYNNGTSWIRIANNYWSTTGNSGTTYGTHFLGTTDATDVALSRNSITQLRIGDNTTTVASAIQTRDGSTDSGDILAHIYKSDDDGVLDIYEDNAYNHRIHGNGLTEFNNQQLDLDFKIGTTGAPNMFYIDASTNQVYIKTASPYGTQDQFTSYGALNSFPINGYTTGSGWAVYGENLSTSGGSYGVVGISKDANEGHGVGGVANGGSVVNSISGYSIGVVGNGAEMGVFGQSTNTSGERYGGYFAGGDITDASTPIAMLAGYDGTDTFGGYFDGNSDNDSGGGGGNAGEDYAYVGIRTGGTTYKILGTGSNSTMVNFEGQKRILFSPEAPEILFQDFGTAQLNEGQAYIDIDPILGKNIHIDKKHPLKVFIQLEGRCHGVFVSKKTKNGFLVTELNDGKSSTAFSWQIVATRADTYHNGSIYSKHSNVRFPIGPKKIPHKPQKQHSKKMK